MALTEQERAEAWATGMRAKVGMVPGDCLKTDWRAVVNAIDDYYDANGAAMNTALPQPFRGSATTQQKALAYALVALRRAGFNFPGV